MKEHRWIGAFALFIIACCLHGIAQAQTSGTRVTPCDNATPNNAICITIQHDGKDTDGLAATGVTYRVEQRSGSGSYSTVATGLTASRYYAKNLAPGSYTFRVYANCSDCTGESGSSNAVSGSATPIPKIPTAPFIIIAAVIHEDGPPTYRIIQSVNLKPNEVVFAAPAEMRPPFASR